MNEKRIALGLPLLLAVALSGGSARAQTPPPLQCPPVECPKEVRLGERLRGLPELAARDHLLSTTFSVQMSDQCIPVFTPDGKDSPPKRGTLSMARARLRTYAYVDSATGETICSYPGPTLRIRKQEEPNASQGDRLKILLVNHLEPEATHGTCNDACAGVPGTDCSATLPDPAQCAAVLPGAPIPRNCCCWVNRSQSWPDCFHGDNTTNLHFHGSHVSPQPPQDYVLLELHPAGTTLPADAHPSHGRGIQAIGHYQYDVDPPPPTQAEGTHWYHPHKHGSVSLQVASGMPGALIIEGAFDDWLRGWYRGRGAELTEKILVMQQVRETTNLYNESFAPITLVNGQLAPRVHMRPGEVQRWRFIDAAMQQAAQLVVQFPPGVKVKQIAMDGVRFSPQNFKAQPLCPPDVNPCQITLSPGNRADFLIQAPATSGSAHPVSHWHAGPHRFAPAKREMLRLRDEALLRLHSGAGSEIPVPPLVTLVVDGEPMQKAMGLPSDAEWPPMPWYLQDLPAATDGQQDLTFQMTGGPSDPTTQFKINDLQYNPDCVNVTTKLGTVATWVVQNNSVLQHPFHIHINPFQLVEQGFVVGGVRKPTLQYASPVWQDTVALPAVTSRSVDIEAGPIWNNDDAKRKCPTVCRNASGGGWAGQWTTTVLGSMSVCGCTYNDNGYVLFRQRYLDFTGEYVLHCHFLGHEDRGMMFNVQTVCKEDPTKIGKSKPYPQAECVPGNLIDAAPLCPAAR